MHPAFNSLVNAIGTLKVEKLSTFVNAFEQASNDKGEHPCIFKLLKLLPEWVKKLITQNRWPFQNEKGKKSTPEPSGDSSNLTTFKSEIRKELKSFKTNFKSSQGNKKSNFEAPTANRDKSSTDKKSSPWAYGAHQWTGSHCTYKNKRDITKFWKGKFDNSTAAGGFPVNRKTWYWCDGCDHTTSHPSKKHNPKFDRNKSSGGNKAPSFDKANATKVTVDEENEIKDDDIFDADNVKSDSDEE